MIIDICFNDGEPKQFQHVRKTEVYIAGDDELDFRLVIRFYDNLYPDIRIPLSRIESVRVTND